MLGMAAVPRCWCSASTSSWPASGGAGGSPAGHRALAFVQFFFGTELLVLTAVAAGIGTVLVVVGAALFRREVLVARARYALQAAGAAVVSSAVLLAWPAWFALAGPAHLSGNIWGARC